MPGASRCCFGHGADALIATSAAADETIRQGVVVKCGGPQRLSMKLRMGLRWIVPRSCYRTALQLVISAINPVLGMDERKVICGITRYCLSFAADGPTRQYDALSEPSLGQLGLSLQLISALPRLNRKYNYSLVSPGLRGVEPTALHHLPSINT